MTFSLNFGALCDPIEKQLADQSILLSHNDAKRFQAIADAITRLHLNNIIPDSVMDNVRKKLMKIISKCIHEGEPPK